MRVGGGVGMRPGPVPVSEPVLGRTGGQEDRRRGDVFSGNGGRALAGWLQARGGQWGLLSTGG